MQFEADQPSMDLERVMADALAFHQRGQLREAQALYTQVLGLMPRHPDALNLLGVIAAQRGQLDHAHDLIEAALAEQPSNPEYLFNLAHVLDLRDDPLVIEAYRRVLEAEPGHLPALVNLGNRLLAAEDYDGAAAVFRRAVEAEPRLGKAQEGLGYALQRLGQPEEALEAFERAQEADPDSAEATANLGGLYLETGQPEKAIAQIRRALALAPGSATLQANLGIALFTIGDPEGALAALEGARRLEPRNVRAVSTLGFVLADLGREEAARDLVDYDRLLLPRRLTTVPGFGSLADFNAALARRVLEHPTLLENRPSKTTRGGGQTGELVADEDPAIAALVATLREVAAGYLERAARDSADPYFVPPPERWRLSLWGTVLGSGGHQAPHNHPVGLVSGVYYVRLPEAVTAEGDEAGWIEFGRAPEHFNARSAPRLKTVRPQEGTLLLFPSYFWHRTVPFDSAERRISIAFDLIPEA